MWSEFAQIARANEAIFRESFLRSFRITVIAKHVHGTLYQHFAVRSDFRFDTRSVAAHIARLAASARGRVSDSGLSRAVAFRKREAQFAKLKQEIDRKCRGTGCSKPDPIQTKLAPDTLADKVADNRDGQQEIQFALRDSRQHALLKLRVEARHRKEACRVCAPEILRESRCAFRKEDMPALIDAGRLGERAFCNVCQRQIREDTMALFLPATCVTALAKYGNEANACSEAGRPR